MSHDIALWPPQGNISALIGTSKGVAGVACVETTSLHPARLLWLMVTKREETRLIYILIFSLL